jgi:hypothetical protein
MKSLILVCLLLVQGSALNAHAGVFTVTNANDGGSGSLRAAIQAANSMPGLDTIAFNIPGNDPNCALIPGHGTVCTITVTGTMTITDPVIIDGYTQPGSSPNTNPITMGTNAVLLIELDGLGFGVNALFFNGANSSGSTVRGLVINNSVRGILLIQSSNNVIEGNFIGTDPTGTIARPNSFGIGIDQAASNNLVGGTSNAARNLISGNTNGIGVQIGPTTDNVMQGNLIGINAAGDAALSNGTGIQIFSIAPNTLVGGDTVAARNVIVGGSDAINISGGGGGPIFIEGNFINTNVTGTTRLGPSAAQGVRINSTSGVIIGGITGTPGLPPGNLMVGGMASGLLYAIDMTGSASGITIQGNMIGLNVAGAPFATPGGKGVNVNNTTSGLIGGTVAGAGNVIAGHAASGIDNLGGGVSTWAILGNSIHSNNVLQQGFLGIDLNGQGVTPNDNCDVNHPQNFPVITSASFGGGMVTLSGTLNSLPNTMFRLEFFSNAVCNQTGFGEGQSFLGSTNVTTAGNCNVNFGPLNFPLPPGHGFVAATATRLDGSGNPIETSEFSQCNLLTGVHDSDPMPERFELMQNYPNPFNPVTNFRFSIVNSQLTILKVYNILGQEVTTLVNEVKQPGSYEVTWDASGFASGVYFYRLHAGTFVQTKKLMLLR